MHLSDEQLDELFTKGRDAAEKGYIHSAQVFLDQVAGQRKDPELQSYLAYCLAKGEGRVQVAAQMCREALERQPHNSLHHLLLGRILMMAGHRDKAIETFRRGLRAQPNPQIMRELKGLGLRKPTVIKALERDHPLNKTLGKMLTRIGLR